MDNDRLKKAREKILSYTDKKWSLKEEGKKLRFETYKTEIVKRIDSILAMREKIDRYIKDINDYAYQCHQLDPQADFFDRWPTVKTPSETPPIAPVEFSGSSDNVKLAPKKDLEEGVMGGDPVAPPELEIKP